MFDAQRLRQLKALGVQPMQLRANAAAQDAGLAPQPGAVNEPGSTQAEQMPLHLWFPPGQADAFAGPNARLLTQILASLGRTAEQVQAGLPEDGEAALLLAFGPGAPEAATRLAALEKLRDPIEKRIAWPLLRSLRRHLRKARA